MGNFERLSVLVIVVIIVMIVVIALVQLTGGDDTAAPPLDDRSPSTALTTEPGMSAVVIPQPRVELRPSTSPPAVRIGPPTIADLMDRSRPPEVPTAPAPVVDRPEPPARPAEPKLHVVQPGETIAKIAKSYFPASAQRAIDAIVKANPTVDPARMRVGTKLTIPDLGIEPARDTTTTSSTAIVVPRSTTAQPSIAGGAYVVRKGDTLAAISRRAYGTTTRWQEIWLANYEAIGDDVDAPTAGTRLTLPR